MQLRKACGHPYLFDGVEDRSLDPMGDHLIKSSSKLQFLDRLLPKLKAQGSRVLIFSQMTRMLDILEDYCVMREWGCQRIDGNTDYVDREAAIKDELCLCCDELVTTGGLEGALEVFSLPKWRLVDGALLSPPDQLLPAPV